MDPRGGRRVVGYLMNTYPLVSTTFIGREIAALEDLGIEVKRYAIRPWNGTLVDQGDKLEQAKTTYLLGDRPRIVACLLRELVRSPSHFLKALRLTLRLLIKARGGAIRHFAYLAEATVLRALSERDGIEHVHAHFSTNATAVAMLSQELGGPTYSFTVHGPDELLTPVENSTYEKVARAKFVSCISHFARSQVMLFSEQAQWHKLKIVHCGVVPSSYGKLPRGPYGKHIVFIGRLAAVKGLPILLEAVSDFLDAHPELKLTIVGDGPDRRTLEAQATALGLTNAVEFLGYQSQSAVSEILERADMLALPSFAEGVPVVLMEAMASRLPVVTTLIAGIPELVEDGVSGFLVPPGDKNALQASLKKLLSQPALCKEMGRAGRAKVEANFSVLEAAKLLSESLLSAPDRSNLPLR
jgi:glycosyltransferase involved in cell wall biosynthesis